MIYFASHASILLMLLVLSAFFSGSETAIFSLNQIERRRISDNHPLIGKVVEKLLLKPRRTLITILIGNLLVNTMAAVIATKSAMTVFGPKGVSISMFVFTFFLMVAGDIMPKVFAVRNNVFFAQLTAIPLNVFAKVIFPIRYLFRQISDFVLSFLIRERPKDSDLLMSENELKALVRIGEEEGVLRKEEEIMIHRLIDFGRRPVKQIMVPRPDLVAFDIHDGREALVQLIKKYHFSHVPIYEENIDKLLGVMSTQEFMLDTENRLRELIQPAFYVPETKLIDELLLEFQTKKKSHAICIDEYGSTAGLVTIEDVLEEIFGEFYDEYAGEDTMIKSVSSREYLVSGKITLHELNEKLKVHFKATSSETLNGWVLERLGRIPNLNESFFLEGFEFKVTSVQHQRIAQLLVRRK